jgi:hypothetical protein
MASAVPGADVPVEIRKVDQGYVGFHVRRHEIGCFVIESSNGLQFAVLDTDTTSKLALLADLQAVRLEAVLNSAEIAKRRKNKKTGFGIFSVSINILGPASLSKEVATRLGSATGYLVSPFSRRQYADAKPCWRCG